MKFLLSIAILITIAACTSKPQQADNLNTYIESKTIAAAELYKDNIKNPRSINEDGKIHMVKSSDWTSGFFPGCLWYAYELSNNEELKNASIAYTLRVEDQKYNGGTHDMGFKVYCSFGNAYRLTGDSTYRDVLIQSAETLITRFNPSVGCLRSWDHNKDKWDYPVIIDNMMNLELLMWAFKETNDSIYYNISVSHANVTLKNHFREDYSTYHVIGYNPTTGAVEQRNTHQGLSHESSWSRGQAWGLYGFTMMYRETGIKEYLEQAKKIEAFIFNHPNLPEDLIPYWDFDATNIPNEPRDASAAAVISSALFELASFCPTNAEDYRHKATKIIASLSSDEYLAKPDATHSFLLEHSTGSLPHNSEIDVPIIYADYYFLEALLRMKKSETN